MFLVQVGYRILKLVEFEAETTYPLLEPVLAFEISRS